MLRGSRQLLWGCTISVVCSFASPAGAWDHPGHMATAAIAFAEIERQRPELIKKIGLLMMKHPDPAPFWVATQGATGKERARRMFIQAARWPDDAKGTSHDRNTWHTARFAVIADDAPEGSKAIVKARGGRPAGDALEALMLNAAMLANPESSSGERALALSWMMHIVADIHQPLHVSDLFSKDFPAGNPAGTMSYVWDPLQDSAMPLHLLWDSNTRRSTKLADVDGYAREIMEKFPRSALPELKPYGGPDDFERWARAAHQIAQDWAFDIEAVPDPDKDQDQEKLVGKMVRYILDGVSPVDEAPKVPAEYWEKLQKEVPRLLALAGYRIADIILAAADRIEIERSLSGKVLEVLD